MKKKIIIDLDGVVFEPIDAAFSRRAIEKYGPVRGYAVTSAYKYKIGTSLFGRQVAETLHECASNPTVRNDAIAALEKLVKIPNISVEFCSALAFPEYAATLENKYRAISPAMNAVEKYNLISPFESKRAAIVAATRPDNDISQSYVVEPDLEHLRWPARWSVVPVLIAPLNLAQYAVARNEYGARPFDSLGAFAKYMSRRTR